MKNYLYLMRLSAIILVILHLNVSGNCQTLLNENFDYPLGSYLTSNGWNAHSSAGVNAVLIGTQGLAFPGYPSSDVGLSASLANNGEDINRTFTAPVSGSVYCAFLIRVNAFDNDYFLHLAGTPVGNNYKGRVFTGGTGNSFDFGLSKGSGTPVFTTGSPFITGTVYLIVLKYTIVSGASNDIVSLYILTDLIPATEPSLPSIGPLSDEGQTDLTNVSAVALRQYSSAQNILIDGIRIAQTWEDAVTGTLTGIEQQTITDNINLSPVPVMEELSISNAMNIKRIEIIEIGGRTVMTVDVTNCNEVRLPVSSLTRGLYFVRLTIDRGKVIRKFIKS